MPTQPLRSSAAPSIRPPEQLWLLDPLPSPVRDRLFFAIPPDAVAATSIARRTRDWRTEQKLQGTPLATDRLHVSLHCLGAHAGLPGDIIKCATEAAAQIVTPPFDVEFDRVASFSGKSKRAFVLYGDRGVTLLKNFQQDLGVALTKTCLGRYVTWQYTPHLTLLYDERRILEQRVEPIAWTVSEFVLVHSLHGKTRHVVLGRWRLHG